MSGWMVGSVLSNAEWHVHTKLRAAGFESWFPYYIDNARQGRWQMGRVRPHIPGYVFIRAAKGAYRFAREKADGVSHIIMDRPEQPATVPDRIIVALRTRLDPFYDRPYDDPVPMSEIATGDPVRLRGGPFLGFVGVVASIIGPEEVKVWLEMMGRAVTVTIGTREIEPLARRGGGDLAGMARITIAVHGNGS